MRRRLLDILECPQCQNSLLLVTEECGERIETGLLRCKACVSTYPIRSGIARFIPTEVPDSSFGFQWNMFRQEQLDSGDGAGLSADRFWSETRWTPAELGGKQILDVGCGAGRFLEIVSATDCDVVGVDASSAIDASASTVANRSNVDLVQADLFKLPFRSAVFDACYCIGVAQHTPDPQKALASLPRLLRPDGLMAVTVYERKPWTLLNGKYLVRPLTRRLPKRVLMGAINVLMPLLFPLTEVLFRLPLVGGLFSFAIPVANYVHLDRLTWRQRYRLALLDTFDRLAPQFDGPLTESEVRHSLGEAGLVDLTRQRNPGVNMVGRKAPATA